MQLSYLLCLALHSAAIATSEGNGRHTTCKAGHKCKTTATVTSTTTSAAPTSTAYEIVQCVDNLPLACCDVVSDGRTVENGKFDNITLFTGCKCFLLGAIGDTDSPFPATGIPPLRMIDTNQASCPIPGKEGDCCTVVVRMPARNPQHSENLTGVVLGLR